MDGLTVKRKIEYITCESGEWEVIRINGGRDFNEEGHNINIHQWFSLLEYLGFEIERVILTDEEMEEGDY